LSVVGHRLGRCSCLTRGRDDDSFICGCVFGRGIWVKYLLPTWPYRSYRPLYHLQHTIPPTSVLAFHRLGLQFVECYPMRLHDQVREGPVIRDFVGSVRIDPPCPTATNTCQYSHVLSLVGSFPQDSERSLLTSFPSIE